MDMEAVSSSNIQAVGYDPESKTMRIQFHNGTEHEYSGVPAETHAALMASDSKGAHLHKHVKSAHSSVRIK